MYYVWLQTLHTDHYSVTSPSQRYELSQLRILQCLSEPVNIEHGATLTSILRDAHPERLVTGDKPLADMEKSGLVERKPDGRNGRSKPYFITNAGRRYLEEARQKALSPEIMPRQDWSAREAIPDLQQTVADFLRTLPEFRDGCDGRLQEVSQQLAQTISQSAAKPR